MHQLQLLPLILTYFLLLPPSYRRGSFFLGPHFLVCSLRCCRTKVTTYNNNCIRRSVVAYLFLPPRPFRKWQQFLLMPPSAADRRRKGRKEGGREILRTPAFPSFSSRVQHHHYAPAYAQERKRAYDLTLFSLCVTSKKLLPSLPLPAVDDSAGISRRRIQENHHLQTDFFL